MEKLWKKLTLKFCFVFLSSVCNVTITSRDILLRSGQTFGEIKVSLNTCKLFCYKQKCKEIYFQSPTTMSGPAFCWYRFKPDQNQRVEIQIYRIKRLGRLSPDTNKWDFFSPLSFSKTFFLCWGMDIFGVRKENSWDKNLSPGVSHNFYQKLLSLSLNLTQKLWQMLEKVGFELRSNFIHSFSKWQP